MLELPISDLVPEFLKDAVGCTFGHDWEADPRQKDNIRLTGPDILFWTFGEQEGTQFCNRCNASRRVKRTGIMGVGGKANNWKPMR